MNLCTKCVNNHFGAESTTYCPCKCHINAFEGISLPWIKQFCLEYDNRNGEWPEHKYEGMSFYRYLLEHVNGEKLELKDGDLEAEWEAEMDGLVEKEYKNKN